MALWDRPQRRRRRAAADREGAAYGRAHPRALLVDEDDLAALHERIDRESAARALHRELSGLPAGERAVLELVALDGLSVGEAGRALGIGAVAARVRLHRVRRRLRSRLVPPDLGTSDLPEVTT